jgi:hypothetical protein
VFGGVADDSDDKDPDENVRHAQPLGVLFNSADEKFAHDGNQNAVAPSRIIADFQSGTFFIPIAAFGFRVTVANVKMFVRVQSEYETQAIGDRKNNGDLQTQSLLHGSPCIR